MPVNPLTRMSQVDTRAVVRRVVGHHGSQHDAAIIDIHATAIGFGIVVIHQRIEHTPTVQVHRTAITGGAVRPHYAIRQVSITPHVDARTAVGLEVIQAKTALGVAALYSDAVQYRHITESILPLVGHGSKPHHVARVACHAPAVVTPLQVGIGVVGRTGKYRFILELPRHAIGRLRTIVLRRFVAGKAAIHANIVAHTERGRISRPADYLPLRLVGARCHPHLARLVLRVVVGQSVYHGLQVTRSILPRRAVARASHLDIAYAAGGYLLELVGTDIQSAGHTCHARQVHVSVHLGGISRVIALVYEPRAFEQTP